MNKFLQSSIIALVLLSACKKSAAPVTIQATLGANQTDTVGRMLAQDVSVSINEPDNASSYIVQIYQTTLCNGDTIAEKTSYNHASISYKWRLNNKVGLQNLKFRILKSDRTPVDSLNVTATALAPTHGWHIAGCMPASSLGITTFARLSTGRMLVGFMGSFYPYYSDDNGISWHPIKSFYFNYWPDVEKIVVSPTDEIFIGSELNGVFYSADGGSTWQNRSTGIPAITPISDLAYMADGSMVFTSSGGGIYISKNKGITWSTTIAHNTYKTLGHTYMAAQSNGDIYFIEINSTGTTYTLMRLDHTSQQLSLVTNLPPISVNSFFIDQNGYMYAGGANSANKTVEIHQSTNNGSSWTKVFSYTYTSTSPFETIENISKQGDGNYYFLGAENIYYKTADFKTFQTIKPTMPLYLAASFTVTPSNYFLTNSYPSSMWYYVP